MEHHNLAATQNSDLDFTIKRAVHAKYVSSPERLSMELRELVGAGHYRLDMRDDVYNIHASREFDMVITTFRLGRDLER